jgi:hypothetical protein
MAADHRQRLSPGAAAGDQAGLSMRTAIVASFLFALSSAAPAETYLASITGISLRADESIGHFNLRTWGVRFRAVCHIPSDWEITAGSFGPQGRISGEAGHGASSIRRENSGELHSLVLVDLSGPVQTHRIGSAPPTFSGDASVHVGKNDSTRTVRLSAANVRLKRADRCPAVG